MSRLRFGFACAAIIATCILFLGAASHASAEEPPPAADAGTTSESVSGCVESIPKGSVRPNITDVFPAHGTSGWAATLSITVRHGKGERVLPSGLDLASAVEAKKYLRKAGFVIPDQDGGAGARLWSEPDNPQKTEAITHLDLPLITLPDSPGRHVMELPPLPVAVVRANGEVATVCTQPHSIVVEDPIASTPGAEPKPNPPPRPQREEWTALKKAVLWGSFGILAGAILAYLAYRWWKRPKPVLPPPPPRPPWEVALEKLSEIRGAGLLDSERYTEYFDRVSDTVRSYLGARFGFDGLESTTDEILTALKTHASGSVRTESNLDHAPFDANTPAIALYEIRDFLSECDLVKFANLTPTPEQCALALTTGEYIVHGTTPHVALAASAAWMAPPPPNIPTTPHDPERERESETDDATKYGPPASQASTEAPAAPREPEADDAMQRGPATGDHQGGEEGEGKP